jgi:hypothetical protein
MTASELLKPHFYCHQHLLFAHATGRHGVFPCRPTPHQPDRCGPDVSEWHGSRQRSNATIKIYQQIPEGISRFRAAYCNRG